MYLADMLSQAYLLHNTMQKGNKQDVWLADDTQGEAERDVESVDMLHSLPLSEETVTAIKEATEADVSMEKLKTIIRQ